MKKLLVCLYSFSENVRTDAHQRCAFLYGNRIIVAHAPRAFFEVFFIREIKGLVTQEKFVSKVELAADLRLVVRIRCHAHQPRNLHTRKFFPFAGGKHRLAGFGREAVFAFFLRDVQFQQAGNDTPAAQGLTVDFLQKAQAVNCMDKTDVRCDVFHLVLLQMADKMPFNVFGQCFALGLQLLHAAFAKHALAAIVGFLQSRYGVKFRDCNKAHALRQAGVHVRKVAFNSAHGLRIKKQKGYALRHTLLQKHLWAKMDSNHRRRKPADLQSAPFGHSGICPCNLKRFIASLRCKVMDYFCNCQA